MSEVIAIEVTRIEARMWAARVQKTRDEVAKWKDPVKREAILERLDSLLGKLEVAANIANVEVAGA